MNIKAGWLDMADYFLLREDQTYSDAPYLLNWYSLINKKHIHTSRAYMLPKRTLLFLEKNPHVVFTDVLTKPLFLISEAFQQLLEIYEPAVQYKDVVLLDRKSALSCLYYLPILHEVDCLNERSTFNLDRSVIKSAVLEAEKIKHYSIFRIGGLPSTNIVVRLDLVESALRRGMRGFSLQPVETVSSL